jgi:hypothetical protein
MVDARPFDADDDGAGWIGNGGGANDSPVFGRGNGGGATDSPVFGRGTGGGFSVTGFAALMRSEEPPTIASGAGVRDGASGDPPGLSFNGPTGGGALGGVEIGEGEPKNSVGNDAAGVFAVGGADAGRGLCPAPRAVGATEGAADCRTDSRSRTNGGGGGIETVAPPRSAGWASADGGCETLGGRGAFGLRVGIVRAPGGGACEVCRDSIRETSFPCSLEARAASE